MFALVKEPLSKTLYSEEARAVLPEFTEVIPLAEHALERVSFIAKERLAAKLATLRREATIEELIAQVNATTLRSYIEYLTGERSDSDLWTRNSFADETDDAANWIASNYRARGYAVVPWQPPLTRCCPASPRPSRTSRPRTARTSLPCCRASWSRRSTW